MALAGLALALCGACGGHGTGGDASVDGDSGQDSPLRIGSPYTLELATWNLRNFPDQGPPAADLAPLMQALDLDFIAVQEIAGTTAWDDLMSRLPDYEGDLSPHQYFTGEYQKVGFLWRRSLIDFHGSETLFDDDTFAFPRPALQGWFTAHHPGGGELTFIAIVVHLKASSGEENELRRSQAVEKLVAHIDGLVSDPLEPEIEVLLLGDFNDDVNDTPSHNVFAPILNAVDRYRILTRPLADGTDYSILPWERLIDHVVITAGMENDYAGGRLEIVYLDQLLPDSASGLFFDLDHVTDHLPVVAVMPWVDY